jgi:hypothetical protein
MRKNPGLVDHGRREAAPRAKSLVPNSIFFSEASTGMREVADTLESRLTEVGRVVANVDDPDFL